MSSSQIFLALQAAFGQNGPSPDTELTLPEAILLVNHAGDANAALNRPLTTEEDAQIDDSTEALGTNDTITFDAIVFATPQTIALGSQMPITGELTINGPGADLFTIDAGDGTDNDPDTGDGFRIFDIDDGLSGATIDVELIGLTLTGGDIPGSDGGGAIRSRENLTLTSSIVSGNSTEGDGAHGGGICAYGAMTLSNSTVSGNHAMHATATGGGIWNNNGNAPINISGSIVAGSPAINAGDPLAMAGVGNVPLYDQRGFAFIRVVGGQIDMGAIEAGAVSTDFDSDGDVDGGDFHRHADADMDEELLDELFVEGGLMKLL